MIKIVYSHFFIFAYVHLNIYKISYEDAKHQYFLNVKHIRSVITAILHLSNNLIKIDFPSKLVFHNEKVLFTYVVFTLRKRQGGPINYGCFQDWCVHDAVGNLSNL